MEMTTKRTEMVLVSDLFVQSLAQLGVSYLFCNLGSDHPSIIESLAKAKVHHEPMPQVVICPHEYVALSAAQGYAQATGEMQAVLVHTDVGTQNLGGAVHNAARNRVPVLIFAGETPYTLEGELPGSRTTAINHLQNVYDQRGIVREYVKWEYEIRTGVNIQQVVSRASQLAQSSPSGPVYLTAAREVLAEKIPRKEALPLHKWKKIEKIPLLPKAVETIVSALMEAERPLIVTSYLGRNREAVSKLVQFCETLAIPVVEENPQYLNFPGDHPLHLGYDPLPFVKEADVIVVIDADAPWNYTSPPRLDSQIFYVDVDPLKQDLPLWYMPSDRFFQADSEVVLEQLLQYVHQLDPSGPKITERFRCFKEMHDELRLKWEKEAQPGTQGTITASFAAAVLRQVIDDDTIVLNEATSNKQAIWKQIPRNKPGTLLGPGGSSLGWSGGAAVGVKLARPHQTVLNIVGDGTYFFSVPSSVYWTAQKYDAPIFTVIINNQGWNAPRLGVRGLHPSGEAVKHDLYWVSFNPYAQLSKIAEAAGGAFACQVREADQLQDVLEQAMTEVKKGRSAVVDIVVEKISSQN
jgi:acetolactate synthase-1/2/3 large subunit